MLDNHQPSTHATTTTTNNKSLIPPTPAAHNPLHPQPRITAPTPAPAPLRPKPANALEQSIIKAAKTRQQTAAHHAQHGGHGGDGRTKHKVGPLRRVDTNAGPPMGGPVGNQAQGPTAASAKQHPTPAAALLRGPGANLDFSLQPEDDDAVVNEEGPLSVLTEGGLLSVCGHDAATPLDTHCSAAAPRRLSFSTTLMGSAGMIIIV